MDGRLSFAFSLRYEIILSMAVLSNPDHHDLQKDWVKKARAEMPELLLQQIKDLFLYSHEAVMVRALSRCEDSIDDILECLVHLSEKRENEIFQILLAEENLEVATKHLNLFKDASNGRISDETRTFFHQELGIQKDKEIVEFSKKYAFPSSFVLKLRETLSNYWDAFFKRGWVDNLLPELEEIVTSAADASTIDILSFMEDQTNKKFKEFYKVIVYISNFIEPHAMGFMEKGKMAVIIDKTSLQSEEGLKGIYSAIIHETLHPLLRDMREDTTLRSHFDKLKDNEELMKLYNETMMGKYGWYGLIEENIILAFEKFLTVKLNIEDKKTARGRLYTGLQIALFDELLKNYDVKIYKSIDNFLLWLLENKNLIKATLPQELQKKLFDQLSKF